jgi:hypothetical protein
MEGGWLLISVDQTGPNLGIVHVLGIGRACNLFDDMARHEHLEDALEEAGQHAEIEAAESKVAKELLQIYAKCLITYSRSNLTV